MKTNDDELFDALVIGRDLDDVMAYVGCCRIVDCFIVSNKN